MQFMVRLSAKLPDSMAGGALEDLFAAERKRALELLREGKVLRMWRVLGTSDGISLWDVESAEEFHAALASLPAWKYCDVQVTPLMQHPLEAAYQEGALA